MTLNIRVTGQTRTVYHIAQNVHRDSTCFPRSNCELKLWIHKRTSLMSSASDPSQLPIRLVLLSCLVTHDYLALSQNALLENPLLDSKTKVEPWNTLISVIWAVLHPNLICLTSVNGNRLLFVNSKKCKQLPKYSQEEPGRLCEITDSVADGNSPKPRKLHHWGTIKGVAHLCRVRANLLVVK